MTCATIIKPQLFYFPVPKNAGTSLRHWFFEIENGWPYREMIINGSLLKLFQLLGAPGPFQPAPEWDGFQKIAVVREPISRLISAYKNRVLFFQQISTSDFESYQIPSGLSKQPDLNTFVEYLPEYRKIPSIAHHTNPQSYFLGDDVGYFDRIFRFERLSEIETFLGDRLGVPVRLPKLRTEGPLIEASSLSSEMRLRAIEYYRSDYNLLKDYYGSA
jgi:hypothetical protein